MTGYGFCGPMTAMGTVFNAKAEAEVVASRGQLMMMGIGSVLLFVLTRVMLRP